MAAFRDHHLLSLLHKFKSEKTPLDVLLRHYFRSHKALGSKDRAWIADTLYRYIRWKNVYDTLHLPPQAPLPDEIPAPLRHGASQKLFEFLAQAYGEELALSICRINQTRAPVTIRVNTLKISREALLLRFPTGRPTPQSPEGITFDARMNFAATPEFQDGLFEVQDEACQIGANLIKPSPKSQILDYCAGAGGKSLAIASHMHGSGQLYLHDIRPSALLEAKKRLKRAGVQSVQFNLPPHKRSMDWVVVDVPCTGSGTYRRNPDLKWRFDAIDLPQLVQEQRSIVFAALDYLRPDGTLVYMTCSVLAQENEDQVEFFQREHALSVVETFQTLPVEGGMDGFFAVSLKLKQPV